MHSHRMSRVNPSTRNCSSAVITNQNRRAPKLLSKYIKSYDSPFPQNVRYFLALTAKLGLANCNVERKKRAGQRPV